MRKTKLFNFWNIAFVGTAILLLLIVIDKLTNTFDLDKYAWDFKYYIAFAKDGFAMKDLISPVAYRYMTPFLAAGVHHLFSLSIPEAFKVLAYVGLWLQLMGIYLFVMYYIKSFSAAVIATLVTAFSAINVKFLLFDPFRPDLFAYFIVTVAVYLAFEKKVLWLMIVTAIGVQFREFTLVPLIAYFINITLNKEWKTLKLYIVPLLFTLILAVLLPRVLIPVTESYQYVKSLNDVLSIPLDKWRSFNWLYTIVIYFLPLFILLTRERIKKIKEKMPAKEFSFVIIYTLLVALLSMYGGTDLARFTTFLFIPQIIFVGYMVPYASKVEWIYLVVTVFLFNKIHMPIPIGDVNWYGGYANIVTHGTYMHLFWMALIILGAVALRMALKRVGFLTKSSS